VGGAGIAPPVPALVEEEELAVEVTPEGELVVPAPPEPEVALVDARSAHDPPSTSDAKVRTRRRFMVGIVTRRGGPILQRCGS